MLIYIIYYFTVILKVHLKRVNLYFESALIFSRLAVENLIQFAPKKFLQDICNIFSISELNNKSTGIYSSKK